MIMEVIVFCIVVFFTRFNNRFVLFLCFNFWDPGLAEHL